MKSKRVLIVDDNDLNRKLFENLIGQLFSFESAKNGLEAVTLAKKGYFDLILMDIQMPLMDGISAMKKIRQDGSSTCPILAVTAYAEESDRTSFLEQGFDDFITKPIRPKEFLQLIQEYLKGQMRNFQNSEEPHYENSILDRKILAQLLKYNSKPSIQKVFQDFLLECHDTESLIDEYESIIESSELIKKIHTLKGNSGTLGAMGIFQSALKAEEYGRNEKNQEFDLEIKKLKNEIRQFRNFLNQEPIFDA
ncbi:MAG TPA: response regulator [Algoriphagus sp.]|nr:response regulator [Algoriphagus sp.]